MVKMLMVKTSSLNIGQKCVTVVLHSEQQIVKLTYCSVEH